MDYLVDECPACGTPFRFSPDVTDGSRLECTYCGASLVVIHDAEDDLDLRLESEIEVDPD